MTLFSLINCLASIFLSIHRIILPYKDTICLQGQLVKVEISIGVDDGLSMRPD